MIGRISAVALDCPDPKALAAFYQELTGLKSSYEDDSWITLGEKGAPIRLGFQRVAEHKPPRWPDPEFPQQVHLEFEVDDVEEAEPKVLALGATRLPGGGDGFRVYADPVGHPFCLIW
jgi:catechol 2,3-dioxygenase-like lactoylglutathione lyase family enzyme